METVHVSFELGSAYERIYIAQFENVQNGAGLKQALIDASRSANDSEQRKRMDYAFIDARLIVSRQQLITAVIEALVASKRVRQDGVAGFKTPSIHSDILYTLNPNNNIGDALHRFGVSKATKTLLLVRVASAPPEGPDPVEVIKAMSALAEGDLVEDGICLPGDDDLTKRSNKISLTDSSLNWKDLSKVYKLQDISNYAEATPEKIEPLVCSAVATKFLS
ncbi:hypothetical protein MYAM1_000970 [Malassezia yamatoensis]|uniref:EKC/KEOPS complex subunit CGI121 n=1 Tax=Malassezia yamatoensis TaxID=253288 RepID=A0AAJ6CGH2_9BASI|nr:hypothetical protein MYAM1_000970 [Malassezia yamatoensis]